MTLTINSVSNPNQIFTKNTTHTNTPTGYKQNFGALHSYATKANLREMFGIQKPTSLNPYSIKLSLIKWISTKNIYTNRCFKNKVQNILYKDVLKDIKKYSK